MLLQYILIIRKNCSLIFQQVCYWICFLILIQHFLNFQNFNCHRTTKPSRIMGSLQCSVQYKLHFLHSYNLEDYTLIYSSPFFISMLHQIIIAFRTSIFERQLSKLVLLFICKAISVFLNSKVSTDIGKTNSFNRYLLRSYPSIWRV